jgi:hypothetical protein
MNAKSKSSLSPAGILFLISILIYLSCNEGNNSANKIASKEATPEVIVHKKLVNLSVQKAEIIVDQKGLYWYGEIFNKGDIVATNYYVVFGWKCPTQPNGFNQSIPPKDVLTPIEPGRSIALRYPISFSCEPRPIVIPCTLRAFTPDSVKDADPTNNSMSYDFTLINYKFRK